MHTAAVAREPVRAPEPAEFAAGPVLAVAAILVAVELATAGRYGFHRDELYFIQCGRHLAWGYVDQPPLVPAVARLTTSVFGASVFWLRAPSALAAGATVVLAAVMTRQLGGRRRAQLLAAVAAATSAQNVAAFHLLSTTAFDILFWAALITLVLRLLGTRDVRLWLPVGLLAGVALLNKLNVLFLLAGLLAGFAATRHRALLRTPWLAAGVAAALVLVAPDVVWNARHDWAQLAMMHALHRENSTLAASIAFIPSQIVVVGPVLALLWIPGAWRLLRHPVGAPLGVAFVVVLALYAVAGAKSYYLAGIYGVLFAAGVLRLEEATDRVRLRRWIAVMVIPALAFSWLVLPVAPEGWLAAGSWEGAINKDLSATVGWPAFVHQVAGVARRLPAAEQRRLVVFTGDYGAAGAVDLYGPADRLPPAISGHNTFWWWGPGRAPNDSTTIAVNLSRRYLRTIFAQVRYAGAVRTPHDVWSEERGDPIWVCTGQRRSWAQAWPAARHYG